MRGDATTAERITADDLLDSLRADYEKRYKWNERAECMTNKVRQHFGMWRAVAVTAEDVGQWQVELQRAGYKDATVKQRIGVPKIGLDLAS